MLPRVDDIGRYAVFLDLDGTLLELEDHFDRVRAGRPTLLLLQNLAEKTGRALAIISGRDIAAIDRILHPLILPVGAVRGLQRRDAEGVVYAEDSFDIAPIAFILRTTIGHEPGIFIEPKPGAVAVHYRLRSDLESRCCGIVEDIVAQRPDLSIYAGKMVFEIAYDRSDKGNTIDTFLSEPPFLGRIPIFAGDDPTDECGFSLVNAKGGISIKVGTEPTVAKYQVANIQELREWLIELAGEPRLEAAQ